MYVCKRRCVSTEVQLCCTGEGKQARQVRPPVDGACTHALRTERTMNIKRNV